MVVVVLAEAAVAVVGGPTQIYLPTKLAIFEQSDLMVGL